MWCKRAFKRCLGKSGNGAFYKRVVRKRGAKKKQTIAEKNRQGVDGTKNSNLFEKGSG